MKLNKVVLYLDPSDKAWFQRQYPTIGFSAVIRKLMAQHRRTVETRHAFKEEFNHDELRLTDDELEDIGGDDNLGGDREGGDNLRSSKL